MERQRYIGEHGAILHVYLSRWSFDVLERVAKERGCTVEDLLDSLGENAALEESTIGEREKPR